ncbi:hypothetical protein F52700_3176 [Fusarium sp. NRRL 52700]|nr:hypothetical protein F52700_3176 [Fusarium sp. NRRL 52700]
MVLSCPTWRTTAIQRKPLFQMEIISQMEPALEIEPLKPSMLKLTDSAFLHLIKVMPVVNTTLNQHPGGYHNEPDLLDRYTRDRHPGNYYNGQHQHDYHDRGRPHQEYREMQRRSRSP